jgi:GTP-binding protein
MAIFRHATFELSAAKPSGLPPSLGAEIAFVGRSNAGKSSAINTLVGHTRLAYVSKTPGRTQLINVFRMRNGAALVDLPGYGFAQVPLAVRLQWQGLLEEYLLRRPNLLGLVLIMDSRRPLTELDWKMVEWFAPTGRPIHCLLTKSDKLTRQAQAETLRATRAALAEAFPACLDGITVQLFSSLKKTGMEEVERVVGGWLAAAHFSAAEAGAPVTAEAKDQGDVENVADEDKKIPQQPGE